MEHGKLAGIVLAILNAVLIVICAVFYFRTDRHKPEFSFTSTEVVYREGIEESALLEGVNAYDSVDGDITDRIVIEKTVENRDDDTIVVFYAVTDKAGNAAKASRVFDAIYLGADTESVAISPAMGSNVNMRPDRDNFMNDDNTNESFDKAQDASGEEAQEAVEAPGEEPIEETAEAPGEELTEETTETTGEETEEEIAEAPSDEPASEPTRTVDSSAPVLTLKVSEVSVNVGQGPAWVDLIDTLQDDKDDYMTLFSNLNVSKYDKNKVGTYPVTVFVEDSDGYKSQAVPLTIIVR